MRAPLAAALLLLALLAGCGGREEEEPDRDGDGLPDHRETDGWGIRVDLLGRREARNVTSDPQRQDTDGDGVLDPHEFALGSDPRDADTDDDGLSDCQEAQHRNRTECEDPDWEGTTDRGHGTIVNNADSDPGRGRYVNHVLGFDDPTGTVVRPVTWGDGIPDGEEVAGYWVDLPLGGRRLVTSDPLKQDSDGDFLEDGEERHLYGADPGNPDSDGDACRDGQDPYPGASERYAAGLRTLQWNGTGEATAALTLTVAGQIQRHPDPAGPPLAVQGGTPAALDGPGAPPAVRPAGCSLPPYLPWMHLEVQALLTQGNASRLLDLHSASLPAGQSAFYWNVRDGGFRTRPGEDGQPLPATPDGLLRLAGADGFVTLAPQAVLPQGA